MNRGENLVSNILTVIVAIVVALIFVVPQILPKSTQQSLDTTQIEVTSTIREIDDYASTSTSTLQETVLPEEIESGESSTSPTPNVQVEPTVTNPNPTVTPAQPVGTGVIPEVSPVPAVTPQTTPTPTTPKPPSGSPAQPTVTLVVSSSSIAYNNSVTLTWTSRHATFCVTPWGNSSLSGSYTTPGLKKNTTYQVTCSNSSASKTESVTVIVADLPVVVELPPPVVTISATDSSIPYNSSTTLSWSSTNATACVTPWGSISVSGTYMTPLLTENTSYTVSCTGPGGTESKSKMISVAKKVSVLSASGIPIPSAYGGKPVVGRINAVSDQVIENVHIVSNEGPCVYIAENVTNVTIRDSEIGPCKSASGAYEPGVFANDDASSIVVERNVIRDVSTGAFFYKSMHPIYFHHNYAYNIQGPFPSGQMIQFHTVVGGDSASKILCNVSDMSSAKKSGVEDHISMWLSLGVANDRTEIAYNRIRGGNSKTGSAIQPGDGGGGNVWVHDNTIVNVGGGGTGIASGENITIERNRIFSDGVTSLSGVGIYVKNYYPGTMCRNNLISNNRVYTWNSAWYNPPFLESYGTDHSCDVTLTENVFDDTSLSASMFNEEYVSECSWKEL